MPGYQRGADYQLPRKGATVTVGGKAYRWDGTRFVELAHLSISAAFQACTVCRCSPRPCTPSVITSPGFK
jgi:hypothetical protein